MYIFSISGLQLETYSRHIFAIFVFYDQDIYNCKNVSGFLINSLKILFSHNEDEKFGKPPIFMKLAKVTTSLFLVLNKKDWIILKKIPVTV